MSLAELQHSIALALVHGPQHVPFPAFSSDEHRTLMGLKVHANTVSHARLVALEDTFPRTRSLLGDASFNRLCRTYLDTGHGQSSLASIGCDLPAWMERRGASILAHALAAY